MLTDKETDESWGHIHNMKNQFWAVGWTMGSIFYRGKTSFVNAKNLSVSTKTL